MHLRSKHRLRSHGTGRIRDCTQIRPVTAVHTKPDKLQAKKCSHGAGRIRGRNYLLAHAHIRHCKLTVKAVKLK